MGVQIQPSRVTIQPGFQSDQAESTFAEKNGSPGQPVSTWADRNPGGITISGGSKVTASPLLDWPHHSRPAESLLLQKLLVEPIPALASAHKPIVFLLKVFETKERVAYQVCLCSPSSLRCLGFLALIYGTVVKSVHIQP